FSFAASGRLPLLGVAWLGNRGVRSAGWSGLVKLSSRWFEPTRYGAVLGVASLSFLLGDAAARGAMGLLLDAGASWRAVFAGAAACLAALAAACTWLLRESPAERGAPEPPPPLDGLLGGGATERVAVRGIALALLRSPSFLLVCTVSVGLTFVRETFNTWTPTYFGEVARLSPGDAARASALFPLLGAASVLLMGWLSDRLGRNGRAVLLVVGIALALPILVALAALDAAARPGLAVALVAVAGFVTIG